MVAVNRKHFIFILMVRGGGQIIEYSKYLSYVAQIGYIEWNHENKSLTLLKSDIAQGQYGVFLNLRLIYPLI